MVVRTWRGAVRPADLDAYLRHQRETGVGDYRATPGNLGVLVLQRESDGLVEVTALSLWTSMDAVRAFAGEDPSVARLYPGDDEFLVHADTHADHYEVAEGDLDPSAFAG